MGGQHLGLGFRFFNFLVHTIFWIVLSLNTILVPFQGIELSNSDLAVEMFSKNRSSSCGLLDVLVSLLLKDFCDVSASRLFARLFIATFDVRSPVVFNLVDLVKC
jgi:hypothetical protein